MPGPPVGRWSRFWLIFQNPGGTSPDWYNSVWFWAFEYLYRPDNPDLQKARAFGEQVGRLLNRFQTLDEVAPIVVKGNFPYKVKGPKTPQTPETVAEL